MSEPILCYNCHKEVAIKALDSLPLCESCYNDLKQ